ncbi:hypothetical protein NZ35_27515 [Pseudomonas chlororaphis]|uniref:Uncharacterized protein n=1 Tax=Pseudomonas chlororaphis TaxID=587753 RepID=A0A0A6D631_9PSED|nr:hypothetical protein NZ35_27515 [Pseudomonas chlororaphis]
MSPMWSVSKMKGRVSIMSKWKRTAKQLCKEFWLPLIVATGWVAYNWVGQTFSIKEAITHFSGSFFFVSYMTGQFFRVRKQAGMEASVASLQQRLEKMINDFQEKSLWTINHITGGDSYCYAEPQLSRQSYLGIRWDVKNSGAFPMYNVTAKIDDLDSRIYLPSGQLFTRSEVMTLGDIPCDATRFFDWHHFGGEDMQHFTITLDSRNGRIIQDIRIKLIDGKRSVALRLTKDGEIPTVLKEVIPENFPRDVSGNFDWSEPEPRSLPFTGWVPPFDHQSKS